jgi:hypothetical protein
MKRFIILPVLLALLAVGPAAAEAPADGGTIMLTVFLRHDQSKTLEEINAHVDKTGFLKNFPPEGVEVVSWHVLMGIGQVITLRLPPEKLRAVNRAVELGAWGAYRSEFYATYDLYPFIQERKRVIGAPR